MFSVLVDLINASKDSVSKAKRQQGSFLRTFVDVVLIVYTLGFFSFRIGELFPLALMYPLAVKSAIFGSVSLRFFLHNRSIAQLIHVASLIALLYAMDVYFPKPLNESYATKTVFITGSNSGVGFETARQLVVNYGMNVIMGCRSAAKCNEAVNAINAEAASNGSASPLLIDLSNFDSVKQAVSQLNEQKIDVLYNNAGYVPGEYLPVNEYGLDPSFTTMHFSPFLLTELLLQVNPSLRVVNTSSGTHHLCALPFTYLPGKLVNLIQWNPGCVDEQFLQLGIRTPTDIGAYYQAKVANVMHAVSIPHNHPQATSVAIDLGWVSTSILPFMGLSIFPFGWMRNANIGVLPAIHAILSSDEELLDGFEMGREWSDGGIVMNSLGYTHEAYGYPWWVDGSNADLNRERMLELGRKLWVTSLVITETFNVDN